jgi:hypothetical protein
MTTFPSTIAAQPAQLELDFMANMPQQLSPAAAARDFAAYRKAIGGERAGNITVTGSSGQ